ncbi:MAG TPA: enoyl-CoA hydratase/isomerase family protein [Anaerolineales bacterium]|nr:enoyl-CoA hydratase/isomerase family protein [Anaerolineales bacterium]
MEFRTLLFDLQDGIATITLNRPEVLNAVNMEMRQDFTGLTERLFFDNDIRVIIFTGAGRGFSSGGDIGHFEQPWITPLFRANSRRLTKFFDDLEALEKPVVGAINGPATGAGLELALACDICIASEQATFGFRENYISLIPGVGGCVRLVRLVGLQKAKELIFTGKMISAEEAHAIGLVNQVTPAEQLMVETRGFASALLKRAPQAMGLAKKILNIAVNVDSTSGIAMEGLAQSILIKTEDHQEGLQAFREKRKPDFQGK